MNYQELKNAIIEVIRTNGNEEITGEVLQFVLLEMVSSLGKDFQFAGVATPQTEIIERDDKVAWVLGAGTYENFGIPFTVAVDEIAFVLYNGTYRVQKVKTGVIVDDTLTREGQNPVKGSAIYAEFDKLRAAGYLFAGVATPSLLPPANLTEKIFYLATQGGEYPNLDNITLQKGINIIRFDGTSWIGESLIAITDEVIDSNVSLITAAGVYSGLSGKVDKAEGMGLSQNSYSNTEKSKLGALPTAQELVQMLGGKQDVLTFDTTPTLNSRNPVTSDGIQRAIEAILVLIPSAASALNQLADKSFVNSTVATASATFRGTYNLVSDLSLAVTATHAQIAAALAGAVSGADNNDYCFVQIPTSADTPTEIRVTERYKFNGETWAYEYDLNNSGFTAAQWEAINSAITSALVTKLSNLPDATQLATLFAGKQNTLTFDDAPVSGSVNPVKSGGIYDAIAAIAAVIPSAATSSNKLVDLNALTAYVTGIIGALDASFDLTSTDGHVTLKMTQVDGVITTLQILTSDIASAQALTTLGGQVSTNADDIAALQALYNALQQSAPQVIEPTDTWPVASPSATVIYRVIDRVNTPPQYYSDYMFKADDLTTPVLMATYNNAIDDVPTAGSDNLVKSGGVADYFSIKTQQVLSSILSGNYIQNNGLLASHESARIYSLNVENIEYVEISMSATLSLALWAKYAFYNTTVENEFDADHLVGVNTGLVCPYSILQKVPNGAKMLLINTMFYSSVPVVKSVRLSKISECVNFDETQDKNSNQKAMARKNIGIESLDSELNLISNGIPTTQAVVKMFEVEKAQPTTALGTKNQFIDANGDLQASSSFSAYKLDVSEMEKIHIKFDKDYNVVSMKYAFYSTDVEANFGSSTLTGIGTKINGPYDEENIIVPQGSVTLVVIGVYSNKPSVFEYKIEPISNEELVAGMAVTVVSNENKISVGYKYNDNNDLLIHFQPCMFNDLMTFFEVGLSSNTEDKPLSTPERAIETTLNKSTSDNIGPVAVTGGTVGGNHSLNNDGETKTAKMDAYEVFVDGAKVSDFSGYADCVVIKVMNTIYDPTSQVVDHILTTPLIKETVLYKIENGDISVLVKHKYVGSTTVSYYAGMQSMFVPDNVMTENGAYDDDWTAIGDIDSFTKSDYPDFNAFFCKNSNGNQTAWLDTSFGIGDHSMLNDADAIFTRNTAKLYHRLIWNKSIIAGTTLKWRGIYSWRTPVRYFYEIDFL